MTEVERCFVCKRRVPNPRFWAHVSVLGGYLPLAAGDDHPDSQGMFPIGSECAKEVPPECLHRDGPSGQDAGHGCN